LDLISGPLAAVLTGFACWERRLRRQKNPRTSAHNTYFTRFPSVLQSFL